MDTEQLIDTWFRIWTDGDFNELPLAENFTHESPYGTVRGRSAYLELVKENKELFTGNQFRIHDKVIGNNSGCVRYTMVSPQQSMEVSEWFYTENGKINRIVAYYDKSGELTGGRGINIEQ